MKSKKIIASLMALSIIGSSSFIFGTSVHAQNIKSSTKVNVSSIANEDQTFTTYRTISHENCLKLYNYVHQSPQPSTRDVADFMIENKIVSSETANDGEFSSNIATWAQGTKFKTMDHGRGVLILKLDGSSRERFTLASNINRYSSDNYYSFSFYEHLDNDEVKNIVKYMRNTREINTDTLRGFLINNNIIKSERRATNIANALLQTLANGVNSCNNSGVYILESLTSPKEYIVTPVPW
ncbi:hypothetical protein [Clostridium scatologenes]|uniref:Uncharacterized protein n=1 Tax=Clostridium scatologenes TaxID=1548 RepID=A0A0E3K0A1_CLOSL|nr:hypothetical protein [Clostridium scatologenes]AKA69824.1 hypothetical protein CSCA_2699 [Clostridium scatologenes]